MTDCEDNESIIAAEEHFQVKPKVGKTIDDKTVQRRESQRVVPTNIKRLRAEMERKLYASQNYAAE